MNRAAFTRWVARAPVLTGSYPADAGVVGAYTATGEEFLAALDERAVRDKRVESFAAEVHHRSRDLRGRFLQAHAGRLYDEITDGRQRRLRAGRIAAAVAEKVPGLVPDEAQTAQERGRRQAAKEGREIDQGILFWGLLSDPAAGRHLMESALGPTGRARAELPAFRRAGRADLGTVRVERDGPAGHVTLANLRCLNAEDDTLVADLETAIDLVLLDDRIRVGVLRGASMTHPRYAGRRVFCAGINLTDLCLGRISFLDFVLGRELGLIRKLMHGLRTGDEGPGPDRGTGKPWVGAVDAFAIGGGTQLLLAMDRVVAGADAYFALPAAQEGIVPGAANLRLTRMVGSRAARRMLLAGERVPASSATGRQLCDEVAPTAAVGAAVDRAVGVLDSPAVVSNRRMLHLAEEPVDGLRRYLAAFAWEQSHRLYSPDVLARLERDWMGRRRSAP